MKIYTKTGDAGTTSLVGGKRVSKCHPRVMAYGDVDELISHIGLVRSFCISAGVRFEHTDSVLRHIQEDLMMISAHFASEGGQSKLKPLDEGMTALLETEIDRMTAELPEQKAFILPSGPEAATRCHVARTVCRRAERSAIAIEEPEADDLTGRRYINRLSDYLFTLARYLCMQLGAEDEYWMP